MDRCAKFKGKQRDAKSGETKSTFQRGSCSAPLSSFVPLAPQHHFVDLSSRSHLDLVLKFTSLLLVSAGAGWAGSMQPLYTDAFCVLSRVHASCGQPPFDEGA